MQPSWANGFLTVSANVKVGNCPGVTTRVAPTMLRRGRPGALILSEHQAHALSVLVELVILALERVDRA